VLWDTLYRPWPGGLGPRSPPATKTLGTDSRAVLWCP
jgi:hypothetical protein